MAKKLKKLKQGGLRRRMALSIAGAKSGAGLLSSRATGMLLSTDNRQEHNDKALAREAKRFVAELGKLKGAYVKIGQMMAIYGEHFLPVPVTDALHELEHQTTAIQWKTIQRAVKQQLGDKAEGLEINEEPIAAASLAQVHLARRLSDDTELCLKIQYPGIDKAIDGDFSTVLQMLKLARWVKQGKEFEAWAKELKALLYEEVDYERELAMTQTIHDYLKGDIRYRVPIVYPELSNNALMAMEYIEGYEVTHPKIQKLSLKRRNALGQAMLDVFLKEVFEWGIMQTDPNFGNYRIRLAANKDEQDQLVLLDFGAMREFSSEFMQSLQTVFIAAYDQDIEKTIEAAIGLNCIKESDSDEAKQSFADFCIYVLEPFRKDLSDLPDNAVTKNTYAWSDSDLLRRAAIKAKDSLFKESFGMLPKEFILLVKKLTGVFSFIATLKAEFNGSDVLDPYRLKRIEK